MLIRKRINKSERELKGKLIKEENIIIYGAGTYGKLMLRWLKENKMESKVYAFAVTNKKNNPDSISGIKVYEISSIKHMIKKAVVIVSVTEQIQKDIETILLQYGFAYILLDQGLMKNLTLLDNELRDLYICTSYYHVLITIIKIFENGCRSDLVLNYNLPQYRKLSDNLVKTRIFHNIYCFTPVHEYRSSTIIGKLLIEHRWNAKKIEKEMTIDVRRYREIYVFDDNITLCRYLQDIRCKYTVLEDCCNYYQLVKYNFHQVLIPKEYTLLYRFKRYINYGYFYLGQSKYCKCIEVNSKNELVIPLDKIKEVPVSERLKNVSRRNGERIIKAFLDDEFILDSNCIKRVLILTQPLCKDGYVSSLEIQVNIYKNLIQEFLMQGYEIYIKPHPRDEAVYEDIHPDIKFIYKYIPTEVLELSKKILFEKVVTISSAAIYNCSFAKEKIFLGWEYLEQWKVDKNIESSIFKKE